MSELDIDLMGFLDKLNPFSKPIENITGTIDTWVSESTLDKDKALELKTQIKMLELEIRSNELDYEKTKFELQEKTYQLGLKTKVNPWVDGFHKLSRTLQGFFQMGIAGIVVIFSDKLNIELDANTLAILGVGGVVSGIYTYKKGAGKPVE